MVATLHGWVEGSRSLRLYTRLEMSLLRRFDALVVVAAEQVERLQRVGVPRARIHQVDNAIELPRPVDDAVVRSLRHELGLTGAEFVYGAVSRLSPEKNLGQLLEAFATVVPRAPDARLLVVGDGDQRDALEAKCRQLSLTGQVRFAGNRSDMDPMYRLLDCLVLPSLNEGMPLVVLEAMARELPVVASAVGDVPRLLQRADLARLVPRDDAAALAAAMWSVLLRPERRDVAAARYVLGHHAPAAMAERYIDIYRRLAGGRAHRAYA
jgi:glycosyltransferase involved in cell wall biosynthesis